jgi:hypothetical protein
LVTPQNRSGHRAHRFSVYRNGSCCSSVVLSDLLHIAGTGAMRAGAVCSRQGEQLPQRASPQEQTWAAVRARLKPSETWWCPALLTDSPGIPLKGGRGSQRRDWYQNHFAWTHADEQTIADMREEGHAEITITEVWQQDVRLNIRAQQRREKSICVEAPQTEVLPRKLNFETQIWTDSNLNLDSKT